MEWGLEGGDSVEVWPAGMLSESQLSQAWARRFRVEFQRFLMELSVRPGSSLAMWAQRLPYWAWAWMIRASSLAVKGSFLRQGASWLRNLQSHAAVSTTI